MIQHGADTAEPELAKPKSKQAKILKFGLWAYFFLLIFEGALRKWVLPGLSGPLLIVRDPVAIGLILYAWYYGLFPKVSYVVIMAIISLVAIFTTLFIGHGNIAVTAYGARILLIHFPLIFLFGAVFNRADVVKIGIAIIWISIPLAVLLAMQFYSPQSAWVNRGIGGDLAGSGFTGAMGYYRPTATFSFTNGTTLFFSLVACFLFYFWLSSEKISRLVLLAASMGLLMAIPFSISRALAFTVVLMLGFVMIAVSRKPKFLGRIIVAVIGISVIFILISGAGFFSTATDVFLHRFDTAGTTEGGIEGTIINRYLGGLIAAVTETESYPFFGLGLGMGTNAGAALLGSGRTFLISEGDWGRIVGEMGALLGLAVIAIRLVLSFKLGLASYGSLRTGDVLPWMLLSFALLVFPQGQWAQPTTLGFSTLIMGLLIASFNNAPPKIAVKYNQVIA